MAVYRGRCDAPSLVDGVEIVTATDILQMHEGDELDIATGGARSYRLATTEPGDLVRGIAVRMWGFATTTCELRRVDHGCFRLSMAEAQGERLVR